MTFSLEYFPAGLNPEGEHGSLSATAAKRLVAELSARRDALRAVPLERIVRLLAGMHTCWELNAAGLRSDTVEAVAATTGYARETVDQGLERLFASMGLKELERWVRALGLESTEQYVDGVRIYGPDLGVLVSSGNIPGAALPSLVQYLLLRTPLIVKTSVDEPVLLPLYAEFMASFAPELAQALVVTHWPGGDEAVEGVFFGAADAVVAYGGDATIQSIRDRLRPGTRFIGYGHRLSVILLGREVLTTGTLVELAGKVAWDHCIYDQQGCLSPQAVFVESGGEVSPEGFAEALADAFEGLTVERPRRQLAPAEASAIHQYRAEIEMRSFRDERCGCLVSGAGTVWTVVVDPDPLPGTNPLNRTAILKPVERLEAVPELLGPWRDSLISAGLEAGDERRGTLVDRLASAGFTRITRAGRAQEPASALYHDGVDALRTLARHVVVED